jgi:AbrB family looped-hinge helix DNA binding protein
MLTTKVGPDGRILVPVELRRELSLAPGETLVVRVEDERLILESREAILRRVQDRFVGKITRNVSLADELIMDRRRVAERE